MKYFTFLFPLLFYAEIAFCQAGNLDSSFNKTGIVQLPLFYETHSVHTQHDGKVIVSGAPYALVRYLYDGILDTSFNSTGLLYPKTEGAILVQSDDKIEMVDANTSSDSSAGFIFTRYNTNGTIDQGFGDSGTVFVHGPRLLGISAVLQKDDKIYLLGSAYPTTVNKIWLAKFNTDGSPDSSFGQAGTVEKVIDSSNYRYFGQYLAVEKNDRIIVGTTEPSTNNFLAIRFFANGSIDSSYGINGRNILAFQHYRSACGGVALQNDSILISVIGLGNDTSDFRILMRFKSNGNIDSSFGEHGQIKIDLLPIFFSYHIQPDNKILIAGSVLGAADIDAELDRFTEDGAIDSSFGIDGRIITNFYKNDFPTSITIDPNGRIVTANTTAEYLAQGGFLARYLSGLVTGIINFSKPNNSVFIYPNPIHSTETLQYALAQDENLSINLYDISGRLIQSFFANQKRTAGNHSEQLSFNPSLPSGNYMVVISNGKNNVSIQVTK